MSWTDFGIAVGILFVIGLISFGIAYLLYSFHFEKTKRESISESIQMAGFVMFVIVVFILLLDLEIL